jgi:hypothetical protein
MSETSSKTAPSPDATPENTLPLGKWLHNSSEDGPWHVGEEHDTKNEAVLAAIYDYGVEVGDVVWVGKVAECPFPRGFMAPVHLDQIAESFEERLGEEIGEASEQFDWFGREEERAARKSKDPHAWRARTEIEKEVCTEIEKVIEAELRKRGLWKDSFWFTLDDLDGVTVTQELFDASMKEHE